MMQWIELSSSRAKHSECRSTTIHPHIPLRETQHLARQTHPTHISHITTTTTNHVQRKPYLQSSSQILPVCMHAASVRPARSSKVPSPPRGQLIGLAVGAWVVCVRRHPGSVVAYAMRCTLPHAMQLCYIHPTLQAGESSYLFGRRISDRILLR